MKWFYDKNAKVPTAHLVSERGGPARCNALLEQRTREDLAKVMATPKHICEKCVELAGT